MGTVHRSLLILLMFSPGVCECLGLSAAEPVYTEGICLQDQKCINLILSSLVPWCSVYMLAVPDLRVKSGRATYREDQQIYIWLL